MNSNFLSREDESNILPQNKTIRPSGNCLCHSIKGGGGGVIGRGEGAAECVGGKYGLLLLAGCMMGDGEEDIITGDRGAAYELLLLLLLWLM